MMKIIKGTFTIVSNQDIPAREVYNALLLVKEELQLEYEIVMGANIDDGEDEV